MPLNLAGAAGAWAAARQRGVAPKTFADLLSIEPEMGSHIEDARAVGHDDQTILDNLDGALPSRADPRAGLLTKLNRIGDLPEDQRSFALFDTRDDYEPLGLLAEDIDRLGDGRRDRDASIGEYERQDGADNDLLMQIGNPANPGLRREWERANGRPWPRDPITGRNYDVAHIKAVADGGKNTLDNIRPMHPLEHRLQHMLDGDFSRWPKRHGLAKTFGGKVLPYGADPGKITPPPGKITPRANLNGFDLSIIPDITGVLSGRIRTDTMDNFVTDMMGPAGPYMRERFLNRSPPSEIVI